VAQAAQNRMKTLIVHSTEMVACDFVNSYKKPGLYAQGAAYCKQFLELNADVLLATEIVSVAKREGGGYTLQLHGVGGCRTAETRMLVDTTLEREGGLSGKSLNALIIQQQGKPLPPLQWPGVALVPETHGESYHTAILKFECDPDWDVAKARHRLVDAWLHRPEPLLEWRMAAIAFCFEERTSAIRRMKDENYAILPAAAFAEPEISIAAGIELGRSLAV
jgi:hypothetical protein